MTREVGGRGRCVVCTSEHKAEIEEALAGGEALRAVAKRYKVGLMSLSRHRANHPSPAIAPVVMSRPAKGAETLVGRLEGIVERAQRLLDQAEHGQRLVCPKCHEGVVVTASITGALAAMRELRANLELLGKVTGEIDSRPTTVINVQTTPEWLKIQSTITEALAPFPEARLAVADHLRVIDA